EGDVTDLVSEHTFHFVVGHQVHQAAVNTYAAVGHGPGIDIIGLVNLVGDRRAVDLMAEVVGDLVQALGVGTVRAGDVGLGVHLGAGLVGHAAHFGVTEGDRLYGHQTGL